MSTPDKIRSFLETAVDYPAKSKLESYLILIRSLRKKRWTYRQIADALHDEFQLSVAPSTIHNFLKVRARRGYEIPTEEPAAAPLMEPQSLNGLVLISMRDDAAERL